MKTPGFYWWWDDKAEVPGRWVIVEVAHAPARTLGRVGLAREACTTDGRMFDPNREGVELRGPLVPPAPPRSKQHERLWGRSALESPAERERQAAHQELAGAMLEDARRHRASTEEPTEEPAEDNWRHRSATMRCQTCIYYVPKGHVDSTLGRCRRRAPTLDGWPAVYETDWCGDHKLDAEKT